MVALDGKLYCMGGRTPDNARTNGVEVYDPVTDAWSAVAPMIDARDSFGAGVLDGKIVVCGGAEDEQAVERYCPSTDSWERLPPMLTGRSYHGVAVC